jgi:hypothetical protein
MALKRRSLILLLGLTSSIAAGVLASPAEAASLDLTCVSTQRTTYSPGVTLFPSQQTIQNSSIASPCVSSSHPEITSGTAGFTTQGIRSCLTLDQIGGGTAGILWNTGQTTTYVYNSSTQTIGGQIVLTIIGTVTGGLFQGKSISFVLASPSLNVLSCLIPPGITSRLGVGTLTIA